MRCINSSHNGKCAFPRVGVEKGKRCYCLAKISSDTDTRTGMLVAEPSPAAKKGRTRVAHNRACRRRTEGGVEECDPARWARHIRNNVDSVAEGDAGTCLGPAVPSAPEEVNPYDDDEGAVYALKDFAEEESDDEADNCFFYVWVMSEIFTLRDEERL